MLACLAAGWLYIHHQIEHLPSVGLCGLGRLTPNLGAVLPCAGLGHEDNCSFAAWTLKSLTWRRGCWG